MGLIPDSNRSDALIFEFRIPAPRDQRKPGRDGPRQIGREGIDNFDRGGLYFDDGRRPGPRVDDVVQRLLGLDRMFFCGDRLFSSWKPLNIDARDLVIPRLLGPVLGQPAYRAERYAHVEQISICIEMPV